MLIDLDLFQQIEENKRTIIVCFFCFFCKYQKKKEELSVCFFSKFQKKRSETKILKKLFFFSFWLVTFFLYKGCSRNTDSKYCFNCISSTEYDKNKSKIGFCRVNVFLSFDYLHCFLASVVRKLWDRKHLLSSFFHLQKIPKTTKKTRNFTLLAFSQFWKRSLFFL